MGGIVTRRLLLVAAALFLGWWLDYALWAVTGFPYDCENRSDCEALGKFLWNNSWPAFLACVAVAGVIVALVARHLGLTRNAPADS